MLDKGKKYHKYHANNGGGIRAKSVLEIAKGPTRSAKPDASEVVRKAIEEVRRRNNNDDNRNQSEGSQKGGREWESIKGARSGGYHLPIKEDITGSQQRPGIGS